MGGKETRAISRIRPHAEIPFEAGKREELSQQSENGPEILPGGMADDHMLTVKVPKPNRPVCAVVVGIGPDALPQKCSHSATTVVS